MKRLVIGLFAVGLTLSSCSVPARPEGILERWFRQIDRGEDANLDSFGDPALAEQILPSPREKESLGALEFGAAEVSGDRARTPFKVNLKKGGEISGVAVLEKDGDSWIITAIQDPDPNLNVPSEGGERTGSMDPSLWLIALAAAAVLTVMTVLVMRAFAGERTEI